MTPRIIEGYRELHLEILRLKYVLVKVAESYTLAGGKKVSFRDRVVSLADELNAHTQSIAANKPTKYNMDEFEKSEGAYIRRASAEARELQSAGLKLLRSKVNFKRTAMSEPEINEQLVNGRIFDAPTMGKDKLDNLDSVRRFLAPEPEKSTPQRPRVERDLQRLKLENYVQTVSRWKGENPDILFRVRAKLEATLSSRPWMFVSADAMQHGQMPNRGDLYCAPIAGGGYALHYCEGSVCLHLVLDLMRGEGDDTEFVGRISGWAEAGADRTEFSVMHPRSGARSSWGESGALLKELLDVTATAAIYEAASRRHQEWKQRDVARSERVRKDAKEKVSRALDELM